MSEMELECKSDLFSEIFVIDNLQSYFSSLYTSASPSLLSFLSNPRLLLSRNLKRFAETYFQCIECFLFKEYKLKCYKWLAEDPDVARGEIF